MELRNKALHAQKLSGVRVVLVCGMRQEYLLTSYVSTSAVNPSGNASANEISAASSPSLASVPKSLNSGAILSRHCVANFDKSCTSPDIRCASIFLSSSITLEKDVMNACAWVPPTGMLNNLPARTLLVPSKPPTLPIKYKQLII